MLSSGEQRHDIWFVLSDPHLEALKHTLHWQVQPHIGVDLMPPSGRTINALSDRTKISISMLFD